MAILFNGKRLVKPQAETKIDTSALVDVQAGIGSNICIIGEATGGEPGVVQRFNSPATASSVLRSGDLLTAMKLAWDPSPTLGGPASINAIRINSATKATNSTALVDSGSNVVLTASSKDYGVWTNSIDIKVTEATTKKGVWDATKIDGVLIEGVSDSAQTKQITFIQANNTLEWDEAGNTNDLSVDVSAGGEFTLYADDGSFVNVYVTPADLPGSNDNKTVNVTPQGVNFMVRYTPTNSLEQFDNLGSAFSVRYTGAATNVIFNVIVDAQTGKAVSVSTTGAVNGTDNSKNLSIDLTDTRFDTIAELVSYINAQEYYVADLSENLNNSALPSSILDQASVDITNNNLIVTANLGIVVDRVTSSSSFVDLEKVSVDKVNALSPEDTWEQLTGGSEGSNTIAEWMDALATLENEDMDIIVPISVDTTVQALVKAHVDDMGRRKKERRAYYGHPLDENVRNLKRRRAMFNDRHSMLITPGVQLRDDSGDVNLYDASFTAAAVAGIAAGFRDVAEPLTYKFLNVIGLEKSYTDTEIDDLLESGVAPVEFVQNTGFRLTHGRTTYTLNDNTVFVEDSVSRVADFISQDMRRYLEDTFVGIKGTREQIMAVKTATISKLQGYERNGLIVAGVDPDSGAPRKAFEGITVEFTNRTIYVSYQVSPVEPINYIAITTVFKPASIIV